MDAIFDNMCAPCKQQPYLRDLCDPKSSNDGGGQKQNTGVRRGINQSQRYWGRDFKERHALLTGNHPSSLKSPAGMAAMLDMRNHSRPQAERATPSPSADGLPKQEAVLIVKFDWKRRQWMASFCNDVFAKMMSINQEEIVKKPWKDVLCGKASSDKILAKMAEQMESKRLDSEEYSLILYKLGAKFGNPVQVTVKVQNKVNRKGDELVAVENGQNVESTLSWVDCRSAASHVIQHIQYQNEFSGHDPATVNMRRMSVKSMDLDLKTERLERSRVEAQRARDAAEKSEREKQGDIHVRYRQGGGVISVPSLGSLGKHELRSGQAPPRDDEKRKKSPRSPRAFLAQKSPREMPDFAPSEPVERREILKLRNSQSIPKPLKPLVQGEREDDGSVVASL